MEKELQNLQKSVQQIYKQTEENNLLNNVDIQQIFSQEIHQKFWTGFLNEPFFIKYFEVQKPWTIYWNLNSLACIKKLEKLSQETRQILSQFILTFQTEDGGFSGSQKNQPHLLASYAAILSLALLGIEESWKKIDLKKMEEFILSVKNKDGSYNCNQFGEKDLRATYCALVISKLLNIQNKKIYENVFDFIQRCQTYEGGIGPKPFDEAHGGFTYCGIASLCILDKLQDINIERLIYWLVNKQDQFYGGFRGRTNKLVDSCYSFWQASSFNMLAEYDQNYRNNQDLLYCQEMNQKYILFCCQDTNKGGFIDKPGKGVDFYHSNYAMMGLALSCNNCEGKYTQENNKMFEWKNIQLEDVDPVFAISRKSKEKFLQYFSSNNI